MRLARRGAGHRASEAEVEWFIALSDAGFAEFAPLPGDDRDHLRALVAGFSADDAQAIKAIEEVMKTMPSEVGYEWSGLTLQEKKSEGQATIIFGAAVLSELHGAERLVCVVTDSDVNNYREDFTNPTINWSDSGDISRRFRDGLVRERVSKLDAALEAARAAAHAGLTGS